MSDPMFSYRVNLLNTKFNVSSPVPKLRARIQQLRSHSAKDAFEPDPFNPDTLNLTSITLRDSGECFFACLSMALYGTEDEHYDVRTQICNFIETEIIPNYNIMSPASKLSLNMMIGQVCKTPYTVAEFENVVGRYI